MGHKLDHEPCVNCGRIVVLHVMWVGDSGPDGIWYHEDNGLPACDYSLVDPEALSDCEGDKYPIATPVGLEGYRGVGRLY